MLTVQGLGNWLYPLQAAPLLIYFHAICVRYLFVQTPKEMFTYIKTITCYLFKAMQWE